MIRILVKLFVIVLLVVPLVLNPSGIFSKEEENLGESESLYVRSVSRLMDTQQRFLDHKNNINYLSPIEVDWNLQMLPGCRVGSKVPYKLSEEGWVQTDGLAETEVWDYYLECSDLRTALEAIDSLELYHEHIHIRNDIGAIELRIRIKEVEV